MCAQSDKEDYEKAGKVWDDAGKKCVVRIRSASFRVGRLAPGRCLGLVAVRDPLNNSKPLTISRWSGGVDFLSLVPPV